MDLSQTENLTRVPLEPERIARVTGYGMAAAADGYLFRPTSVEEIWRAFQQARTAGRKVVLRGAGRSYGDAALADEAVTVDIGRMRSIRSWDPATGILEAESGATIEHLWKHTLEDGYWPPVVSGTMFPTLAGALAMNIHGKNNFRAGTLGEHVLELDILTPRGELLTLTPSHPEFYAVVSGAGLLGAITRVKLQMKRIYSGDLRVLPLACRDWDEQFAIFEEFEPQSDYMVSWVDCYGAGAASGRGTFHAAWYEEEPAPHPSSLRLENQELPDTIMGFLPKSIVWRGLQLFNNQPGMHLMNWAKYQASRVVGDGKPHHQSLVAFSFLLDYVPNWRWAYLPDGFIQYQTFVPKEHARRVFQRQVELQQEAGLVNFLGVLKRHRPDRFMFSHAVDGYSLAQDFKVTRATWPRLRELCHRMNDVVLEAGGRFYFAKDSTMRPSDARGYLGDATLAQFRELKGDWDPEGLLTSSLARRLELA